MGLHSTSEFLGFVGTVVVQSHENSFEGFKVASKRLDLTPGVVKEALKLALEGSQGIVDYCDRLQPYLVLRVRGHVGLMAGQDTRSQHQDRGRDAFHHGGPDPRAAQTQQRCWRTNPWDCGRPATRPSANGLRWAIQWTRQEEKPGWTWGQLVEGYKAYISDMREDFLRGVDLSVLRDAERR